MTSYSTAHVNIELLSKDEEGMSFQFIRESPGLEATIKVLVKFITFRMTSGDKAPESALSSDEGSESDSLHRGRHTRVVAYEFTRSSSSDPTSTSIYQQPSQPSSKGSPTYAIRCLAHLKSSEIHPIGQQCSVQLGQTPHTRFVMEE